MAPLLEAELPALRRYARVLCREPYAADDLVQDTLERGISRWPMRRRDSSLRAWLFAIMHNLFISGERTRRRRGQHHALDETEESMVDPAEAAAARRDLLTAFDRLTVDQRAILLLVGVEDLSYAEAARVLGVPVGTVMSRLSRGRERLRKLMDGEPVVFIRRVK